MELQESLVRLNAIYMSICTGEEGVDAPIDPHEFALAWECARLFRHHSLLNLAKIAYTTVGKNIKLAVDNEKDAESKEIYSEMSRKLIDFSFQFLTQKQIAFLFDLLSSFIDSRLFELTLVESAIKSKRFSGRSFAALKLGIEGASLSNADKLSSAKFADATPKRLFPSIERDIERDVSTSQLNGSLTPSSNGKLDPSRFKSAYQLGATALFGEDAAPKNEGLIQSENLDEMDVDLPNLVEDKNNDLDKEIFNLHSALQEELVDKGEDAQ